MAGPHDPPPLELDLRTLDSVTLAADSAGEEDDLSPPADDLDEFARLFAASGLHSVVGHTLSADGDVYGAIVVARTDTGSLGPIEVELLNAVGASVAQAIYGARLVADLRLTNAQLVETQQQIMNLAVM